MISQPRSGTRPCERDENFDPIQDEMELGMVETLNKIIGKGDLRTKLKSKEGGKVDSEMDHFDDFQEKDGHASTKPLDVLPNKPSSDDFGDNETQEEINLGEIQEKLDLSKDDGASITRKECVSIGFGKIQEDKNPVMNETSKLTGRNVFLNMPHSYDFRDNIVKKGVRHHEILSSTILSSYLSLLDSFSTSTGDWLALNSTNQSIHLRQIKQLL